MVGYTGGTVDKRPHPPPPPIITGLISVVKWVEFVDGSRLDPRVFHQDVDQGHKSVAIGYFRNIKIQLDSEAQRTKTIQTNYNEVKDDQQHFHVPLFLSSKPRYKAEF